MTSKKAAYNTAYNKANTVVLNIRLNKRTDKDIIRLLADIDNKSGYIKELMRADKDKSTSDAGALYPDYLKVHLGEA